MLLYALIAWLGQAALAAGVRYAVASYRVVGQAEAGELGLQARWLDHVFISEQSTVDF